MSRIKGVNVLRGQLYEFEREVLESITHELIRIGRRVEMEELRFNCFNGEIRDYVQAIYLDADKPMVEYWLSNTSTKLLSDFARDQQITHWGLTDLLSCLKGIEGMGGVEASICTPVKGEYIGHQGHWDTWVCMCNNHAERDGFYTCDADGNLIEATVGSDWDELYRCERCGRVIDQRDHKVIGINLNPNREEEEE